MNRGEEVKLTHSGVYASGGRRHVSVRFERSADIAEGSLLECKIKKNSGFSTEEIEGLENYLQLKCDEIFAKAKELNNFRNIFG